MAKKIFVLGPLPPPLGGVSIHIVRYLELLKSTGWKAAGYSYTGTTQTGRIPKLLEILKMFVSIYLRVTPGVWDVLHLHYGGMGYFLALVPLLKISPGRRVVTFHSVRVIEDLGNRPRWVRRLALSQLNRFDLFVVVREGIGEQLRDLGLTGPEVVVMPAFLPPAPSETRIEKLPPEIAGNLLDYHAMNLKQLCCAAYYLGPGYGKEDLYGVEELLEVLTELDGQLSESVVLWVLVSNGPDSEERKLADRKVRSLAAELDNVHLELHYGLPLVPVMARCQGFVRPSREDGDSVALREALGLGLPVLASDVVGRPPGVSTFVLRSRPSFTRRLNDFVADMASPGDAGIVTDVDIDRSRYTQFAEKVVDVTKPVHPVLKSTLIHLPMFLFLLALVFVSFGTICSTPLSDPADFQVLTEAHTLVHNTESMFRHVGFYFSQPVLQLAFLLEFKMFGIDPAGYIAVNLLLHTICSFLVYMLVNLLFYRKSMALLSAVLFAFGVGSYGKIFMAVHQLESILLACLHLMVLYFFIRNDHRHGGALRSPFFVLGLILFLMTGLTRHASFSLIGSLLAYKIFFHRIRGWRAIFSTDLIVLLLVGGAYYWAQGQWGYSQNSLFTESDAVRTFSWLSLKNIFRYLTLMFFPMQNSRLVEDVPFFVTWAFEARSIIRMLLTWAILSYSFFGFVFGGKAVRFFIAWTYISLLPFTGITATGSWLNLNHLYLTSLGFCVIVAAGSLGTSGMLARRRWRKYVPYSIPLIFVLISLILTAKLNERNIRRAATSEIIEMQFSLEREVRSADTDPQ